MSELQPAAETTDPGEGAPGAPDPTQVWAILDPMPERRGTDWYPELEHAQ